MRKIFKALGFVFAIPIMFLLGLIFNLTDSQAQFVDDASDGAIGAANTKVVLGLISKNINNSTDAKVTSLREIKSSIICGSVNVRNQDGLYLGERGFVVNLADATFGRVPEGRELMDPRVAGFDEKERIRELYFEMCLN